MQQPTILSINTLKKNEQDSGFPNPKSYQQLW